VRNYVDLAGMLGQIGAGPKGTKYREPYAVSGREPLQATGSGSEAEIRAELRAGRPVVLEVPALLETTPPRGLRLERLLLVR